MHTILIVDDEPIERNGIKSLIKRFQFDLTILEADNGERALDIMKRARSTFYSRILKCPSWAV